MLNSFRELKSFHIILKSKIPLMKLLLAKAQKIINPKYRFVWVQLFGIFLLTWNVVMYETHSFGFHESNVWSLFFLYLSFIQFIPTFSFQVWLCSPQNVQSSGAALETRCVYSVLWTFLVLSMLIIKPWFCVEADVTTCLLEKEGDTCTEKVLVAYFHPR